MKPCTKCGTISPLDNFHRHPTGRDGRHSWCKPCANAAQRGLRKRAIHPAIRRRQLLMGRYKLTLAMHQAMIDRQGNACGICQKQMTRPCVDHDHATGAVRGLLCQGCNIKLAAIENADYRIAAIKYLEQYA